VQEKIRGFLHLYIGEEAVAVGVMQALSPEDAVVATYREHGHALARGVSPESVMAEMYGKRGCSRGRGGSMHLFDAVNPLLRRQRHRRRRLPLAVGLALADKCRARPHHDLLLRRGRGGGRRVSREHEPGRSSGRCRCCSCARTIFTRWAPAGPRESHHDLVAKARATAWQRKRGRHGRVRGRNGSAARRRSVRTQGTPTFSRVQDLSISRALDVRPRSSTAQRKRWRNGRKGPIRRLTAELREGEGLLDDETLKGIEAVDARSSMRAFCRSGHWEPVASLLRDVGERGSHE
jgi:pyruvate dehydrogenase E1 component alpha subunit